LKKLVYPAFSWFLFFLIIPLGIVLFVSFISRSEYGSIEYSFQIDNYLRVFQWVYLKIFASSLKLAFLTSLICLVIGFPIAWVIATSKPQHRPTMIMSLAIPFLTNLIIRIYATKLFVGIDGPIQGLLKSLGFSFDPFYFTQNEYLVLYGLVTTYLPFMIFPLYAAFEKFNFSLVEAALDLGASQFRILFTVLIPNMKTAIVNGFILVFIPCLGEFVIPDLLGGAKNMLVGNLITEQFLKARDWPFGAALSMILIAILVIIPILLRKAFLDSDEEVAR
jgi:spermidine/putrescine transport system permease protein